MLTLHVLASGSKGNAALVTDDARPDGFLIDCGICKRDLLSGLENAGFAPQDVTDILITHDHSDHTKGLGVCTRALSQAGAHVRVRTSRAVREASAPLEEALEADGIVFEPFRAGEALTVCGMQVHPFPTSHDAAESFGFRVECGRDALAYLTDTGRVTPEAHEALQYVRLLALEANHDGQMLREGPYPYAIKRRIASDTGHLSNAQAAAELEELLGSMGAGMLEAVVAMHVSQENNLYSLAQSTLADVLARFGHTARAHVAHQRTPMTLT